MIFHLLSSLEELDLFRGTCMTSQLEAALTVAL